MAVVVDCRWSEAGKREEKMCVPCKLDSEGKVLKTDKCTLNGLLLSVLVACSSQYLLVWFSFLQPHFEPVECSVSLPGGCILFISSALSRSTAQPEH